MAGSLFLAAILTMLALKTSGKPVIATELKEESIMIPAK